MGWKDSVTEIWIKKQNKQTKTAQQKQNKKHPNQLQEYICTIKISKCPEHLW